MAYADDTQLYTRLRIRENAQVNRSLEEDVKKMEKCLEEIRRWMANNKLKLNEKKTEVLVVTTKTTQKHTEHLTVKIGDDIIKPSSAVRDLGGWLDDSLSLKEQVSRTARAGYQHLRSISRIRRNLDMSSCAKVMHSTVTSRLDFHNALLAGTHQCITRPLQRLQNHAARVLTGTAKSEHISPILKDLHWLPTRERSDYKLLVLIHDALHSAGSPKYMKDMFELYTPLRPLRSSGDAYTLLISHANKYEGRRCPSHYGAKLWNSLPLNLRCNTAKDHFKKDLKTLLFNRAFT